MHRRQFLYRLRYVCFSIHILRNNSSNGSRQPAGCSDICLYPFAHSLGRKLNCRPSVPLGHELFATRSYSLSRVLYQELNPSLSDCHAPIVSLQKSGQIQEGNLPGGEPFVEDEEEGEDDEEGGEEDSDELFVENNDKVAAATFGSKKNKEDLCRDPPLGKGYPRARNFISHFVGDEGEKENEWKYKQKHRSKKHIIHARS